MSKKEKKKIEKICKRISDLNQEMADFRTAPDFNPDTYRVLHGAREKLYRKLRTIRNARFERSLA